MTETVRWLCPACGAEYLRDVGRCADCDAALVADHPADRAGDEPERIELCPVVRLTHAGDIAFARSMLESAGIAHHMRGEHMHGIYGGSVAGTALFGPVEVHVDKRRADEAVAMLSELIEEDWGDD